MLKEGEVVDLTGLSRSTIRRRMSDADFPLPRRLGPKAIRWYKDEVDEWLAAQPLGGRDDRA